MTEYRRRPNSDVWHFHPRCRWWPFRMVQVETTATGRHFAMSAEAQITKPTYGEFCNECRGKTKHDAK